MTLLRITGRLGLGSAVRMAGGVAGQEKISKGHIHRFIVRNDIALHYKVIANHDQDTGARRNIGNPRTWKGKVLVVVAATSPWA